MWPGGRVISVNNLFLEILLRVIFLGLVCISQLKVHPLTRHVTEAELLNDYGLPRHDSYVPAWATVLIVVFVPLFFILIPVIISKDYVDALQGLLSWTLALTINAVITESLKLIVGRPRPDYLYRCYPDGKITPGLKCTGNTRDIMDGRKSFPSGHSSFAFCSLGFISLWLCGKLGVLSRHRGQRNGWLVCLTPLIVAGVVAFSRQYDNHHHWEDVIVGAVLGFAITYFCYLQYYYPLGSLQSGEPYEVTIDENIFNSDYHTDLNFYHSECCTQDVKNVCVTLHFCNKHHRSVANKKSGD